MKEKMKGFHTTEGGSRERPLKLPFTVRIVHSSVHESPYESNGDDSTIITIAADCDSHKADRKRLQGF